MSYAESLSGSSSATTGVGFSNTYTQQSIAESAAIPTFITTEANIPNGFTAVPQERVSDIIQELNTYECGEKQLEDLKSLCTNNNFQIQFVYFTSKDNGSEYALKVNESITQFGSQSVLHTNIIYICVDKNLPQSIERNVCIYDKTKHTIEKTKTYIIQDDLIKSDAYKVGHELSHATVFIKFLSDIKKCFKDYVELTGTKKENIYNVSVKDKYHQDTTLNEYQKEYLNEISLVSIDKEVNQLSDVFMFTGNKIVSLWERKRSFLLKRLQYNLNNQSNLKKAESIFGETKNTLLKNLKCEELDKLFGKSGGEEARNLLGLNESMDVNYESMVVNSSNKTIGEFHYINKIYQESHGNNYNIIRMPYNSKANWDEITDCDEIIKRIFQKKFNLKDDEI